MEDFLKQLLPVAQQYLGMAPAPQAAAAPQPMGPPSPPTPSVFTPEQVAAAFPSMAPEQAHQVAAASGYTGSTSQRMGGVAGPQQPQAITIPDSFRTADHSEAAAHEARVVDKMLPGVSAGPAPIDMRRPAEAAPQGATAPAQPSVIMAPGGSRTTLAHEVNLMGPTQRKLLDTATESRVQGELEHAHGQATAFTTAARNAQTAAETAAGHEAGAANALADKQRRIDDAQVEATKAVQAAGSLKVDPNHLWNSSSTMSNIGTLIAVGLGGFGAGLTGGRNQAWDIIRSKMDDDVKAQMANIEGARGAAQSKQNVVSSLVQRFGQDPARDMLSAAQRERVAAEVEKRAAESKVPEVMANAEQAVKNLRAEAAEFTAKAGIRFEQTKTVAAAPQYMVNGIPIPLSAEKAFAAVEKRQEMGAEHGYKMEEQANKPEAAKDHAARWVPGPNGTGFLAADPAARKEIVDARSATEQMISTIDKITAKRKAGSGASMLTGVGETAATLDTLGGDLNVHFSHANKLGTYDDGTERLLKKITGDPNAILTGDVDAKLATLRAQAVSNLQATMKSQTGQGMGAAPIKEHPHQ